MNCPRCGAWLAPKGVGRPPIYCSNRCREGARKPRAHRIRRRRKAAPVRPVVAVDSETVNGPDGRAKLVMLAASTGQVLEGDPITSQQALDFLLGFAGTEVWTFFGDYDVNFWLRDLSLRHLNRLRRKHVVFWGEYRIRHIPRRSFEIWHRPRKLYVRVYDAFPFVQSSFVRWLEEWKLARPATVEHIRAMKERRAEFAAVARREIRRYTLAEVRGIAKGVRRLKNRIRRSGLAPGQWLGPGSVAAVALRRHAVKEHFPRHTHPWAESAYYGGRIETSVAGLVPGPVYYYDINSAYPAAAVTLPCLRHGEWKKTARPETPIALVRVRWRPKTDSLVWGPFPCRPKQGVSLRYYARGTGVYWWDEVEPWMAADSPVAIEILQCHSWIGTCAHRPFAWLQELYDKRQALKARDDPGEYALKLVLNSCYGKLAQRVGRRPFHCLEYAGLITARTRRRLASMLLAHGKRVLIVATDGVLLEEPAPIPESRLLGAWAPAGVFEWADVYQPGFYVLSDGYVRSRGFTRQDVDVETLRQTWQRFAWAGTVEISRRSRLTGYRLASHRRTLKDFCRWDDDVSVVSFLPEPRRRPGEETISRGEREAFRTLAPLPTRRRQRTETLDRRLDDYRDDGEPDAYFRD